LFSLIKRWRLRRNDVKASEAVLNQGVSQETASDEQLLPKTDALDVQIASATTGADFSFLPNSELPPGLVIVPGSMEASLVTTGDGRIVLRLANGDPKAHSAGPTGGYSIRVSDQTELAASGKPVRVLVVARVAAAAPSSRLAVAYSTNEVGNSGWRWFSVGQEWAELEMDYDVPPMRDGHGDFIGLLPDEQGAPAVEVSAVAVRVNPVKKQADSGETPVV
jgi:hypothetical protein